MNDETRQRSQIRSLQNDHCHDSRGHPAPAWMRDKCVPEAPVEEIASPNATDIPPTAPIPTQTSPAASPTETIDPSPSPTAEATSTPTTVSPTETTPAIATEATATPPGEATPTQAQDAACNTSVPSRLSVG